MAQVVFKKGLRADLPAAIVEGVLYITTDERAMYLDVDGSTRVRIGDFQEFDTLAALRANTNPSTTALYYVGELNCLAKWDGEKYIQINLDTGATSVETTGTGNALDGVTYDPASRRLTFTKANTFLTADDMNAEIAAKVGELKIGDETFATVKAYVDRKTDDIVTGEALTLLGGRVTAAEGEIDTLVGTDTGKSARTIANEELAKQLIPENAQESMDTLAELAAWMQEHPKSAQNMNKAVNELKALVGILPDGAESATVVAYIKEYADAAISALSIGDYAKAADLTALAARAAVLEESVHTHGNMAVLDSVTAEKAAAWDAAEQNAKDYADEALTWGTF